LSYVTTASLGEQPVDCLFGEATSNQISRESEQTTDASGRSNESKSSANTKSGYGLFTPDHTLIPGTAAEEEAVKTAVGRLHELLQGLLAAKLLQLTPNPVSSKLPLRLTLSTQSSDGQLSLIEETLRSRQFAAKTAPAQKVSLSLSDLSAKSKPQQYRAELSNPGKQTLYYVLINVMERSQLSIYCPALPSSSGDESAQNSFAQASQLASGARLMFPRASDSSFPLQDATIFAIACTQPFSKTWKAVQTAGFREMSDRWSSIPKPLSVANAILEDIDRAGRQSGQSDSSGQDVFWALRSDVWACLSV
jgi:hypothetical protein